MCVFLWPKSHYEIRSPRVSYRSLFGVNVVDPLTILRLRVRDGWLDDLVFETPTLVRWTLKYSGYRYNSVWFQTLSDEIRSYDSKFHHKVFLFYSEIMMIKSEVMKSVLYRRSCESSSTLNRKTPKSRRSFPVW